jgi:hypothetical protein
MKSWTVRKEMMILAILTEHLFRNNYLKPSKHPIAQLIGHLTARERVKGFKLGLYSSSNL